MPVALEADQTAVVRVLVPNSVLERGVASAWAVEAALGITLVASAVFVADRLARTIVRPVDALADAAGRLGEGDLSVRINPEGPPEVKQVAVAFNRLGDRVGELLEAERELVADLSHRLRTPLTVLRLDAEGLDDPAGGPPPGRRRRRAGAGGHRRDPPGPPAGAGGPHGVAGDRRRPGGRGPAGLLGSAGRGPGAVVRVRPRRTTATATGRRRSTTVAVSVDELEAALDALLGNVFAHTPEGTAFRVEVRALSDGGISAGGRGRRPRACPPTSSSGA